MRNRCAHAVFIGGMWFPSIFNADEYSGIRSVSIWKAFKKSGGFPVMVRKVLVTTESWVETRLAIMRRSLPL
jgi:hypothetical protein